MENLIPTVQRTAVTLESVIRGDVIYLSPKDDATPYQVIDLGSPFILIENLKSHFGYLYRVTGPLYKDL